MNGILIYREIKMKKFIIAIILLSVFQTISFADGKKLGHCKDDWKVMSKPIHGKKYCLNNDGSIGEQNDESIYTLGKRYNIVNRTNGINGVDYDEMSDGSINKYYYVEGTTKIDKVVNDQHGLQHKIIYYDNGNMKYDVSYVIFLNEPDHRYVETNREDGKPDFTVTKDSKGNIVASHFTYDSNGNQIGFQRAITATKQERNLYKKYLE